MKVVAPATCVQSTFRPLCMHVLTIVFTQATWHGYCNDSRVRSAQLEPRFIMLHSVDSWRTTDHADMVELVPGTYAVDVGENPNNPFLAENWDGTCVSHLERFLDLDVDSDLHGICVIDMKKKLYTTESGTGNQPAKL